MSDKTIELILNDALIKLNYSLPLTQDELDEVIEYFWNKEGALANAKESYNKNIDEKYLLDVSNAVTELNDIDLNYLNQLLIRIQL